MPEVQISRWRIDREWRFKRQVLHEDIIKETKRHSYYLKPGQKKRLKSVLARKRDRKRRMRERTLETR